MKAKIEWIKDPIKQITKPEGVKSCDYFCKGFRPCATYCDVFCTGYTWPL